MRPSSLLLGARKLAAITSKRGNKNFYKGRGAPAAGSHTARGGYKIDPARVASYVFVAPDLTGFKLKAYVAANTPKVAKTIAMGATPTTTETTPTVASS